MERLCARFFLHKFLDFIDHSRPAGAGPPEKRLFAWQRLSAHEKRREKTARGP